MDGCIRSRIYGARDVLVFGCESAGLSRKRLADHAPRTLRIPVHRHVRSLNLSNAVAVASYEALRQWNGVDQ